MSTGHSYHMSTGHSYHMSTGHFYHMSTGGHSHPGVQLPIIHAPNSSSATTAGELAGPIVSPLTRKLHVSLPGPATVADGSGAALHPRQVARRSRAPCRRSEARVARPVTRPSPEARPVMRPLRNDRRKRDLSATSPRTVGTPHTAW
eukprot:356334-Chlamydomonas_euryale.AAC.3